jgi:GxxExxY protein
MADEIIEKDLSFRIMKAAFEVHNELGPGFTEGIYDEAMAVQLPADGLDIERQKRIKVYYRDRLVGEYVLDLVVNNRVILEFKAVSEIAAIHEQQALSYLKATGLHLAIVINFGTPRVQYRRIVNTPERSTHPSRTTSSIPKQD